MDILGHIGWSKKKKELNIGGGGETHERLDQFLNKAT